MAGLGSLNSAVNSAVNSANSAVNSAVSSANAAVNSAVSSATNSLNSLANSVSDGLKQAGVGLDKIKDTLGGADFLSDLTQTASAISKQAQNVMTQGTNMLNAALDDISSSFPDAVTSFFGQTNSDSNALTSIAGAVAKGSKEVDAKLQSLASDASEAIANPVSFVTKPVSDTIKGSNTLTQGAGLTDLTEGLSSLDLSNIGKSIGSEISSSSDLSNAIKDVTNSLSDTIKSTTSTLKELKTNTVESAISTVKDYSGALMDGIASTVDSITGEGTALGELITGGQELTDTVLDALPDKVSNWVTKKSDAYINNLAQDLLGEKTQLANSLLNKLPNVDSSDNFLQKIATLGDSSTYAKLSDTTGNSLSALYGDSDEDTIRSLYGLAKEICSGITEGEFSNFRYDKDFYDILLEYAAELGVTDLVDQLKRCNITGESSRFPNSDDNNPYWDERSVRVLQDATENVARNGNVYMYECIMNNIGASQMKNAEEQVKILVTNLSLKKDKTEKLESYNKVLKGLGYSTDTLVTDNVLNHPVLKGGEISAMSANNIDIIDGAIGANTRVLTQAAMLAYA